MKVKKIVSARTKISDASEAIMALWFPGFIPAKRTNETT
jgi:hypothetical protein